MLRECLPNRTSNHLAYLNIRLCHDGLVLLWPKGSAQTVAAQAIAQLTRQWQRCASLCKTARDHYARLARHKTGSSRARAAKARTAWLRALAAARAVRTQVTAYQALLARDEKVTARGTADAGQAAGDRAKLLIARAWRLGHAKGSRATVARSSAAVGCEMLFTAQTALALLP